MRRLPILILLIGCLLPGVSATVASADAAPKGSQVGVRLVDVPTATADDPRARAYIVDHLKPGQEIKRRIEVVNRGATAEQVSVYAAAARVDKGQFVGEEGRARNDLSSWTSLSDNSVDLDRDQGKFVTVTLKVPPDAVRGERYGVIWAETNPKKNTSGVTHVGRVGIRLYVAVGPGGAPPTDFEITSLTAIRDKDNRPVVSAQVHNTGERALDLRGELSLSDGPAGLAAGPFPMPLGSTLGLGATEPVLIPLDTQLPAGPWTISIKVTSGVTTRTAKATLTFPTAPGVGQSVEPESAGLSWLGITGASVAVLAALIGLVAFWIRRRRAPRTVARRSA